MEVEDKVEPFNPWKVETIDWFLNYCCPECDFKEKTKAAFIMHATEAHPNSREYLPLFDKENLEPLKTEFDASVKLKPLSMNSLLKIECNEENCGRFFLTEEGMIEHKRQFHQKLTRKVKKLDYIEDIEPLETLEHEKIKPTDHLDVKVEEDTNPLNGLNEDSDFEAQEVLIEFKENVSVTKKRKLNDSDDEYGKPVCKKCDQQFPSQSAFNVHKKSVHSGEPKEAQKIGRPVKHTRAIDPTDGIQKLKCDECPMFFTTSNGLVYHKRKSHSNDQVMQKCFLCPEVFSFKSMGKHMKRKHTNANGDFECNMCSKVCRKNDSEAFMHHLTKEHQLGEFRHKCDQCDEVFVNSNR